MIYRVDCSKLFTYIQNQLRYDDEDKVNFSKRFLWIKKGKEEIGKNWRVILRGIDDADPENDYHPDHDDSDHFWISLLFLLIEFDIG